jgi:multiple sugar transport system substrate-binding protein
VFRLNPIAVHERLSAAKGDDPVYCPFAYTYNNYGRRGFGANPLTFGDPPTAPSGKALRTVLGGTGLAISAHCKEPRTAVDFACFISSANVQRTLYAHAGGQPARTEAWADALNNELTGDFFQNTQPAMHRAWTRPRFNGFPRFQEQAGPILQGWIQSGGPVRNCLQAMDALWRQCHPGRQPTTPHMRPV